MNSIHTLTTLISVEPLGWLLVLLAIYFRGGRKSLRLQRGGLGFSKVVENATDYRALGALVVLKLIGSIAGLLLAEHALPAGLSARTTQIIATAVFWTVYALATVCVFFIMAEVLTNSLKPLPGLSSAALVVFRWVAVLTLGIALTAHLPIFGVHNLPQWLDDVDTSFTLCVCTFEVSLLVLLTRQLSRLGMCLRSRPVGIALGLAMLGLMDLLAILTQNLPARYVAWVSTANEVGLLFALGMWTFYIVAPEPARTAHSLSPASKLMRWNEIALQFGTAGRPGESDPFISRVESTVAAILKKHNVGNYS